MAGKPYDEKRMELMEHLAELRTRIMRSILYLILGAIIAYQFFTPIYNFLYRPLDLQMKRLNRHLPNRAAPSGVHIEDDKLYIPPAHNPPNTQDYENLRQAVLWISENPGGRVVWGNVFHGFHEAFLVRLKLSFLFGFILVTPFILWEISLFILPALTPQERKPLRMLVPLSIFQLIFGVTVAYLTMFFAMAWFLSYLGDFPKDAALMQDPNEYIVFLVKMMAAFGVAFQLPVVMMGGAYLGLITSKGLMKHWRWGVVIAVLGGVFTPSNDLISMALMSIPLLILYFGSILLVKLVERIKANEKKHLR